MAQGVELIERLLPKLAIRDRCCIERRFLWVRGSSEDLPDKVLLPFEADTMLSLILSKAFLVAADKKITDPWIVRQVDLRSHSNARWDT
jgi:hypothetical protein